MAPSLVTGPFICMPFYKLIDFYIALRLTEKHALAYNCTDNYY